MKKVAIFLAAIILASQLHAQTKDFTGAWAGKMNAGKEVTIIFHFTKKADGSYAGTLDSPDQNVKGIALSSVAVNGDSLVAALAAGGVTYRSMLTADTILTGTWAQRGASLPLVLKHAAEKEVAEIRKPQTPVPPFSYNSEDVEYDNADKSVHFGATFTFPKTGGTFPTAILITGSGQQDRDETILGHKPFAVLADYLTKKGYAILRVDDRGMGKTTGTLVNVTSADFAKDVEAGLAYIKTRPEVDKTKIGLIGHSEGGNIAPMVAAENKDIYFIVLWAGAIEGGLITNVEQNAHSLLRAGLDSVSVNAFKQLHTKELSLFAKDANTQTLDPDIKKVFDTWRAKQPANVLSTLHITDSSFIGQNIYAAYHSLYNLAWMRFFISHNFAADLARVRCKVLALNGDLDQQVNAQRNLSLIDSVLKANNNHKYSTVHLKGLNHLFQTAVTGDVSEYASIQETIAPQALQAIGDWMDIKVLHAR